MSSIIVYIMLAVLIALPIGLIYYFISYKRNINAALHEDNPKRASLPSLMEVSLLCISIALLFNVITLSSSLNIMSEQLHNMQSTLTEILQQTNKDETTKIASGDYTITSYDEEHHTVLVDYTVTLKEEAKNTSVTLLLGEQEYELTRQTYGTYTTTLSLDIFNAYTFPRYAVTKDGNTTIVEDYDLSLDGLYRSVLPIVYVDHDTLETNYKKNDIVLSGDISISAYFESFNLESSNHKVHDIELVCVVNGSEKDRISLHDGIYDLSKFEDISSHVFALNFAASDSVKLYLSYVDEKGYQYRTPLFYYEDNCSYHILDHEAMEIKDASGKVVYFVESSVSIQD